MNSLAGSVDAGTRARPALLGTRRARRYRTIEIQAGEHILTAADPIPDDLRQALDPINGRTRAQ